MASWHLCEAMAVLPTETGEWCEQFKMMKMIAHIMCLCLFIMVTVVSYNSHGLGPEKIDISLGFALTMTLL